MRMHNADEDCGIAQAATVMGDWWNVLVLREIARGHVRFDTLAAELGLSRKVLTERLGRLVARGVLRRVLYQRRPVRYEYLLTDSGLALLPLLMALQEWGDRWVLGDGSATATAAADSAEHARVQALVGARLPADLQLPAADGADRPVVAPDAAATVLFTYPGSEPDRDGDRTPGGARAVGAAGATGAAGAAGIARVAGAGGENRLFRDAWPDFRGAAVAVHGVSSQLPHEQAALARAESVPYPLLSDAGQRLAAALRLPVFRAAGRLHLKRLVLVIDPERTVRHALFPVDDLPRAVEQTLQLAAATAAAR
ncbi:MULTISPECIES: winged helix-turn-helix transcriptional regulator [unclassified Streptomyces]|uniref:winged helix-turn-helix transcriptional regulator n=1 Tax=unclassified Streptomyces TaxID=2593676 RepID=UPI000B86961A|nr:MULTISPECIES: winged helix-turn-helix transcriptional regulator [unclassified Streptomyces]MYS23353.1 redoxin domain-containing protein [Streptomyces sp. SID4948]